MPPTTTPRRSRTATGLSPIGRHAVPECGANMRDISTSLTARLRASGSICFSPRIRWHRRLRLSTAGIGRSTQSKPIAEALAAWAESTERQLSRKSELALAFRYMRARWTALVRCFDDGRLALDNNPAERALRCVAIGRKNYLFAGSDAGGRRAATIYSLIESAKLNGLNPQYYLADVLARIADHPARRIAELLPWNWQPLDATRAAA